MKPNMDQQVRWVSSARPLDILGSHEQAQLSEKPALKMDGNPGLHKLT